MQYGRDIDQNVKNCTFQSLCESHCTCIMVYSAYYLISVVVDNTE